MWLKEDPFTTPSPLQNNVKFRWARSNRSLRLSGLRLTPSRIVVLLLLCGCLVMSRRWLPKVVVVKVYPLFEFTIYAKFEQYIEPEPGISNATSIPQAAFQPPESIPYRMPDSIDSFADYKYRNTCNVSSLDLHAPFSPLCSDRPSMLAAMSGGGRIGFDSPYMPRGCDMRWYTSEEICAIFAKFEKVVLIGDSMLRHMTGSFNIFVRKDIGYGAVTDWNFSTQERKECFCNEQFDVKACSVQGIYKTADVVDHDPGSVSCGAPVNVMMEQIVRFPAPDDELIRLREDLLSHPTSKPIAVVFGHGLWSDLDLHRTLNWLDTLIAQIDSTVGRSKWQGMFVTPNAAGKEKPDEWIVSQGNKALMLYEESVGIEVGKRGLDHLGTWNMSIQSRKYDGVHLDMKGNLVKAMMVMNWLAML
ncbi:hypothetical protein CJF30_00009994 [Rutstroemia sp. NJR-2017a BBW]|nr:hypothetical protein CJF30_00009994 [Rutstroemia sp. NJR-2017a BBW]